ncbi:hypothetical protein O59_001097 [Cellvibrio sp. BR]|nr:hypothetical protein O59_001097 [Cellvibrio sp. BR]
MIIDNTYGAPLAEPNKHPIKIFAQTGRGKQRPCKSNYAN